MLMGNEHSVLAVNCYRMKTGLRLWVMMQLFLMAPLLDWGTSSCIATHRKIHVKMETGLPCGLEVVMPVSSPLPLNVVLPSITANTLKFPLVCLPSWSLGYKYASCLPDCEQEPENELTVGVVIAAWVNGKLGAGVVKIYELFHSSLWSFNWNALWFYMYSSKYLVGGIVCKRCLNFFSPDKKNPLWSGIAISVSSDYWINLFYSKISWFFLYFWQIHLYIRLISHDPNTYIMVLSWSYNTEWVFSLTILPLLIFIPALSCIILLYCFLQENSNLLHLIWAECFLSCFL